MDSERGGLLKTRAEDFARHLHTRLRSLTEDANSSWEAEDGTINEVYYDIDSSLASPEEELGEPIFITNKDQSFPLQRDGSTDSQYFDSVENVDDLSPIGLKKIPILHLKCDSKPIVISNGHRNLQDSDSGCSRVQEIDSIDLESDTLEKGSEENNCDIEALKDDSKRKRDLEEELFVTNGEAMDIEVDTRPEEEKEVLETAEEASEMSNDSFCVFCDIEQIKTSLSNGCCKNEKEEELKNGQCKEVTIEDNIDKLHMPPVSSEINNQLSPDSDQNISLADLLQVLKQDIVTEQISAETKSVETEATADDQQTVFPDIQVHESSPIRTTESSEKEEDVDCDIEIKRRHFRRSSSLKSGKTPPGTPGRKKIVRFADVLGLDLADVKTFLDEVPTVPRSAYEDLQGIELSTSPMQESLLTRLPLMAPKPQKVLIPLFQQPSVQPNFLDRVGSNNVCLESAYVSDSAFFAVSGLVRVKNIEFHKSVYVRYSIDKWRSFSDLQARYVPNSYDGFSDKFSFVLYAHTLTPGQRLEFAVRFHSGGAQFWDNNGGSNYVFECINQLPPDMGVLPSPLENLASFY